jgi:hypothetical protein
MTRLYYSSRNNPKRLSVSELYQKLHSLYQLFRNKDYFKKKAGITEYIFPNSILHEAAFELTFQPFPINEWLPEDITENHVFDILEFLYDRVSKPGETVAMTSETGWNYEDYIDYDDEKGQQEFRERINPILANYKTGFELTQEGVILAIGTNGLQYILEAEIVPYDETNVDNKVRNAIKKWRNRQLSLQEKRDAIRELADVFEWLKKDKKLGSVLARKDENALFHIANNFGIRHHNPDQKTNYNQTIWYSWIFHFYLATYHAVVRMLIKNEKDGS